MKKFALRPRAVLAAPVMAIAMLVAATPLAAQEAGPGPELDEVIVTAQFRSQNLQDTPIAITAVSAETLENRGQINLQALGDQAPNVDLRMTTPSFGPGMAASIRGVGQSDFNPAFEPGVGIYIDDVYYAGLTGANFDLIDVNRVEIARGPQGTLAGRNSIGGSIKMYSQRAEGDNSGSVALMYGSRQLIDGRAVADFALIPDALFVRASMVSHKQSGYVDRIDYACSHPGSTYPDNAPQALSDCKLGTAGGRDYTGGRLGFRWLAGEKVEVNLSADVVSDTSELGAATLVGFPPLGLPGVTAPPAGYDSRFLPTDPYTSYASFYGAQSATNPAVRQYQFEPKSRLFSWGTAATVDVALTDKLSLKSISAYREYESNWVQDNDLSPYPAALGAEDLSQHQFSQELRLNGSLASDKVEYVIGGYYFNQFVRYKSHQIFSYTPGGLDFFANDPVDSSTYAGFVNATWHVLEKLNINGGVRYTNEEKNYQYSRLGPNGLPHPLLGGLEGYVSQFEGSKVDYRANVDYRWTDSLMTYVSVSTGFKGGGTTPRPFVVAQALPFDPETLIAYEVGAKSDFFDRRLRANAALFLNKYKDVQGGPGAAFCLPISGPFLPCTVVANVGDADVRGAELELSLYPVAGLSIDASASYLDFEYTTALPGSSIVVGAAAPGTIGHRYSAGVQYEIKLGQAGSLAPRVDWSYQSDQAGATGRPDTVIPGRSLLNMRLIWRSGNDAWEAIAAVNNVTDELYYVAASGALSFVTSRSPAPPREWSLMLKHKF